MTNLVIEIFKNASVSSGAAIALHSKLFVPGWELSKILQYAKREPVLDWILGIGYLNNEPCTVCVCEYGSFLSAFTKKKYRKNGHGTAVLNEVLKNITNKSNITAGIGIPQSNQFWDKNGINTI
jgi:hypothetical protein